MARVTCRTCGNRADETRTAKVGVKGGGSYKRPGRFYSRTVCADCIESLVQSIRPGQLTTSQHSIGDLRAAARQLDIVVPNPPSKETRTC